MTEAEQKAVKFMSSPPQPADRKQDTSTPGEPKKGFIAEAVSFVQTLCVILSIAFTLRSCIIEPFKIPSGSMKQTLQIGDYILVLKFWYGLRLPFITDTVYEWNQPKRGDVVVFTRPDDPRTPREDDSAIHIIKRVIGLPGDTIEVRPGEIGASSGRPSGVVLINGQPLEEPYAQWVHGGNPDGQFGPRAIPPGHVLLLGDNRDESKDSRFWTDPFLDIKRIKGKAVIIFWSWDSPKRIGTVIR